MTPLSSSLVGRIVLDIGCPLEQRMRSQNPAGFPPEEGVVVKEFDWGVWLANPVDQADVWTCENGNFVEAPNANVTGLAPAQEDTK